MRKYRNKTTVCDGIEFQSRKEAKRWLELSLFEKTGVISDLQRQVKFILIPAQREPDTVGARGGIKKGKVIEKECAYIADFTYKDLTLNESVVEDTKGYHTKDYIIKRKLMLYVHKIKIKEV